MHATILLLLGTALAAAAADPAALKTALTFHASFDNGTDADFARGDRRLHTAGSYKDRSDAKPGLHHPDVALAPGQGRFGAALQFKKKNVKAVYYPAEKNVAYKPRNWNGTVSFWLNLDPETDLEPGFCDPIQVTAEAYNDAAIWVDFTKDDKPRHFRLGVFGDLKSWNPKNIPSDKNPDFSSRLVTVRKTPFARGAWTNVAIAHSGFGAGDGWAKLYLNGALQGTAAGIREPFTWSDLSRAAIRLGVNYVGLFDELTVFDRALTDDEIALLYKLEGGGAALRK